MLYIKLKNKSEIIVHAAFCIAGSTCEWCGKVIKPGKTAFRCITGACARGEFCSASHAKIASNSRL